jgi:ligand-binding sensor domain-containing protein/signal transduction histidine kinase/DNA-binding response OmpR family regulator
LLILVFSFILPSSGQENRFVFSHLDVNDGLSENRIKCIIKDRNGFIWFGTSTGLNRYDGYEFEVYLKNNADSASVTDNEINAIAEDNSGNLWIGTRTGVNMLDINTYKFRLIRLVSSAPLVCGDISYVTTLTNDSEGNIWIGTHNGLFFYNQKDKSTEHILFDEQSCFSQFNNITALAHDRAGSVWIGTVNGYIFKYNLRSNSIEKMESIKRGSGTGNTIRKLYADDKGLLWIADAYGLCLFNVQSRTWMPEKQKALDPFFSGVQVTGIEQDNEGKIWITTDGRGLFIMDSDNLSITGLRNRPYATEGISSDGLLSLYIDRSGITWIGTAKKGVDFYKKNVRKFQLFRNYPVEKNSLTNNDVNCISEDIKGNLWIGTNGGGLNCLDRKTGRYTSYISEPGNPNSLSSNTIVSVYEDSEHKIWAGTYLGGLNRFDPTSKRFTVFRYSDSDSTTVSDNSAWGICEDRENNLWFATLTNGLNLFDRKTGKFRRYLSQNSSLCFNYLNYIAADKNDNLWIGSSNGLIFFNPKQNLSICYTNNPNSNTSISDNHISSVFEDSRGLFWICTSNGLNLMDRNNGTFRAFFESDGLPSNTVLRILEDKNSTLWISTKNGISKMSVSNSVRGDPPFFDFKNYRMSDGLQGKEFNETAAASTHSGELFFGGPDGLNGFYPLEIREDTIASKLVFTNLRIFNTLIRPGEQFNSHVLLEKPVFNTDEIVLRYRENSFTLDFAALNYFFPERTEYSYKLEGFNGSWIKAGGRKNFANYSNLNHGSYRFRLRGTNSDGIWNKDEIFLKIRILPPLWKTWYAYVIYTLLGLALLLFIRYFTMNRVRMKLRIEQERLESQHIHEIDSIKIKFFTNISHEFRTPLTLILSPVEQLIRKWKGKPEENQLTMIRQNAKRLLLMVNQLLDFRKMEVQGFRYSPSFGDIISFLADAVNSFNDLSEQKHIQLSFRSEIERLDTWFDKDKLEKIMFNLLSNAFKFVNENGIVSVNVRYSSAYDRKLTIEVKDNGIGIPEDKIQELFSRSYHIETPGLAEQGNGIGLSLVNEFVKLHDGEIEVKSEIGKGSTFIISLPLKETVSIPDDLKSISLGSGKDKDSILGSKFKPVILIAEDNDDLRFYLKENLQNKYQIFEASNGEIALAKIPEINPDIIISDIMMPGLDGIELCKRIKGNRNTSHIPFILLTAKYTEEQQLEGIEAGAEDYITKPFNFQILESKIDNLVKIRDNIKSMMSSRFGVELGSIEITSRDEQFLQKVISIVEKNMAISDFTVNELSREMGMSRTLLYKKLLALTGKPPLEFIRSLRLKRAALLLEKSQLNVSEITFRVGFKDLKYFRKHFLKEFGVLPSKFIEEKEPGENNF